MASGEHGHSHTLMPTFAGSTSDGLRALLAGTAGLLVTAVAQLAIVLISGSIALLADTLHNGVDVLGTVLVAAAFLVSRRASNKRYSYGYHRYEDLAGLAVVVLIAASAVLVFYESAHALGDSRHFDNAWWVFAAGAIGFAGNEAVAQYKIRAGRRIGSSALIADGKHSRADGLTSLGVVAAAIGSLIGADWLDGTLGFAIGLVIAWSAWEAGRDVLLRLTDSAEPELRSALEHIAEDQHEVDHLTDLRIRHLGRTVHVVANICVRADMTLREAHDVAEHLRIAWLEALPGGSAVDIHVDPDVTDGESVHHDPGSHVEHAH